MQGGRDFLFAPSVLLSASSMNSNMNSPKESAGGGRQYCLFSALFIYLYFNHINPKKG